MTAVALTSKIIIIKNNKGDFKLAIKVKKVMDDYLMAWNSHDINKILSFFTDDGIYEDVAHGIVNHGKKEITGYLKASFTDFPDLKIEVKAVFGIGDWIVFEIVTSGTHAHSSRPEVPATGKTFSIRAVSVFKMSKGKISRQSEYYNYATLLQQVGLMPAQPK